MGSGSTIIARQSASIYIPILIAICLAVIVFIIFLITRKIHAIRTSPEYIAKQKERQTTLADIKKFKVNFGLTNEEASLLWNVCEDCHAKNINYLIYDTEEFDNMFRREYISFREREASDKRIADFFQLRYKLERMLAQSKKLSSTLGIPAGAIIFYIDQSGEQFPLTLLSNTKSHLDLEVPPFMNAPGRRPEELKRARFMFKTNAGMTYIFTSRPIRYEKQNSTNHMIVAHSQDLILHTQRQTKREFVQAACRFTSVKIVTNDDAKPKYTYSEKSYPAQLVNVSAGGCCIHTKLPIKANQLLSIFFPELDMDEKTVGIIRHTRFVPTTNMYALHIQFVNITVKVQNRIYAYVYKFEL